jgi:hypoxanthine phosphoribosyltransferase
MAGQLDAWSRSALASTGQPLLALCVLRGGVFFFSDLLQAMEETLEPAFCRAWSYVKGVNGTTEAEVRIDWLSTEVLGRDLVLVDNICDSGRTLEVIRSAALAHGAVSVRSVTMVHRLRSDAVHTPTLTGFRYEGSEWLVGYGLRDGELRSNLPSVFRVGAAAVEAKQTAK